MIELETGNPWNAENKPSSYSRFLLPFSYTLNPANAAAVQADQLCFRQIQPKKAFERERLLYFTAETANVLFQRAIWAEIDAASWQDAGLSGPFSFKSVERESTVPVCIAPPRLILFEGCSENPSLHPTIRHGFLILDTFFPDADQSNNRPSLDDLLEFNELFRYTDCPFPEHSETFIKALADFPANYLTGQKIGTIQERDAPFLIYKSRWLSLLYNVPLRMKNGQYRLPVLPPYIACEQDDKVLDNHLACTSNNCLLYADNRAFVWTAAIVKGGGLALAEQYGAEVAQPWELGHWCKLLNVDRPGLSTELCTNVEKKWTKQSTYQRWVEYGTWYGYSYHSGAMLADALSEPPLWRYFGEMYFDQVLLLFYLRITLFSFSRELTRINQSDSLTRLSGELNSLRISFTKFANLYQPPMVSNQQQGSEMYNAARNGMDIDNLFKEVRGKINGTDEFVAMKISGNLNRAGVRWTAIAAIITFGSLNELWLPWIQEGSTGIVLLLTGILLLLLCYWLRRPLFRLWKMRTKPMF